MLSKNVFGLAAHAIIEQFMYAKMPPYLKKSINEDHLENGTFEQIVTHLAEELELNGLDSSWKATNKHCDPTCHKLECRKTQTNLPPL